MKNLIISASLLIVLTGCGTMLPQTRAQRVNVYLASHPDTSPNIVDMLRRGKVVVGMTGDEVLTAFGQPRYTNVSSTGFDQWVFGDPAYGATYIYLDKGQVVSWSMDQ